MGPRKPPKPKQVMGLQSPLLAVMMAGSADSFKKRQLPHLKPQDKEERPSAKMLTTWLHDDDGIDADTSVPLEGTVIDTNDENVLRAIIPILHAHRAPTHEYHTLKRGEDYTKTMILSDWDTINKEIDAYNAQMMIALADCGMPEIYDRVDREYNNDYHPLVIDDHSGNAQCAVCAANNRRSGHARMISVPLYGLDQGSSDVTSHELQLAMLSKDGMTETIFHLLPAPFWGAAISGYF